MGKFKAQIFTFFLFTLTLIQWSFGMEPASANELKLQAATAEAHHLLRQASLNANTEYERQYFAIAESRLSSIVIMLAKEGEKEHLRCQQGGLAFTPGYLPYMVICRSALAFTDLRMSAQVIVHEMMHLMGEFDECKTTLLEAQAMKASGAGVLYESGYWKHCGLEARKYYVDQSH